MDDSIRVLLVDDCERGREQIERLLEGAAEPRCDLVACATYAAGLAALLECAWDAVLVADHLGPCGGMRLVEGAQAAGSCTPLILLTDLDGREIGVRALRAGAVGYLNRQRLDATTLTRALPYAVKIRRRPIIRGVLRRLARLEAPSFTGGAAGADSLQKTAPDAFGEFVRCYGELMDLALENRTYKEGHDVSSGLKMMAQRLGERGAGPRDVIDIHYSTTRARTDGRGGEKSLPYVEEGNLMALEMMGHLADHYRSRAAAGEEGRRQSSLDAPAGKEEDS